MDFVEKLLLDYGKYDYLSIELGGYGRDRVVEDDIVDGDVDEWEVNPYEIIC